VISLQALIFVLFGAWMAIAWFVDLGLEFLIVGALLFTVGLVASKEGEVATALALLIEATYLTTLGAGTANWGGYSAVLDAPFWIVIGLSAIAVVLLLASWFREDNEVQFRGPIAAAILVVAVLLGIEWYFWVIVPFNSWVTS
jgi:hypothetical protein